MMSHGEKILAGQARARARGKKIGRKPNPNITPDVLARARAMCTAGERMCEIARVLQVPTTTLRMALTRPLLEHVVASYLGSGTPEPLWKIALRSRGQFK
jgi:DNA invertase Pin-like site-specific DNA recombinase